MLMRGVGMKKISLGEFIINNRHRINLSSRQLALLCNITPPYLNDIEKNKRTPSFEVLNSLAHNLQLQEEEIYKMFDLAASGRNGKVSYDISEYIMENANLRKCIRKAIKCRNNSIWDKLLEKKSGGIK